MVESYHSLHPLHEVEGMARKKKPVSSIFWVLGLGVWLAVGWACTGDGVPGDPVVPADESGAVIDLSAVQSMENQWMTSAYFDRAMGTKGARFQAVPFSQLVARNEGEADAVLLNCFDDYQGIVSVADIRKYDLQLATRLELPAKFKKPDWLNPLIIIVPDGSAAPFQERFMTANIRELRLVRLRDYYAPIDRIGKGAAGLPLFKDNCLFCHSLMHVGGNKGVNLLQAYDVSTFGDHLRFTRDFSAFHNPASSQNLQQFVDESALEDILDFLQRVAEVPKP